ncbi:MAG TPA: cytochrome c [Alphaproteobacteria bacterium]|nr:cytochrome c [Alphaproteobacteria bacterium]
MRTPAAGQEQDMAERCGQGRIRILAISAAGAFAAAIALLSTGPSAPTRAAEAQSDKSQSQPQAGGYTGGGGTASELLQVPVVKLLPGGIQERPQITSPVADDPQAAQRGMEYFNNMNCVGCHAPNGAGGMGPSLSNVKFIYGREPENIYLTILQGRPKGMPAWGGMLPDQVIWDLVAYVRSISKEPAGEWGKTTSADGFTIEQVPAEFKTTPDPWQYTEPFSYGQPPFEKGGQAASETNGSSSKSTQ